jgi:hypothetical protein
VSNSHTVEALLDPLGVAPKPGAADDPLQILDMGDVVDSDQGVFDFSHQAKAGICCMPLLTKAQVAQKLGLTAAVQLLFFAILPIRPGIGENRPQKAGR